MAEPSLPCEMVPSIRFIIQLNDVYHGLEFFFFRFVMVTLSELLCDTLWDSAHKKQWPPQWFTF